MARQSSAPHLFGRILCPVDFSAHSKRALRYAWRLARTSRGQLTVLYVSEPLLVAAWTSAYGNEGALFSRTRDELRRYVTAALPATRDRGEVEVAAIGGDPAVEICRVAAQRKSDLIVLGTHGAGAISRRLLGSTTARVMQHATVPVLAVPWHLSRATVRQHQWPWAQVTAPIDLSRGARDDVARAASLARACGLDLTLVHVVEPTPAPPWAHQHFAPRDRARRRDAEQQLTALAATVVNGLQVRVTTRAGKPANAIAALARAPSTGLLVLTARKGPGFFGHRPGAIAYHSARDSRSPILVLPPRAAREP